MTVEPSELGDERGELGVEVEPVCHSAGALMLNFRRWIPASVALLFRAGALAGLFATPSCGTTPDPSWTFPLHDQLGRQCEYHCDVSDCRLDCESPAADAGLTCASGTTACLVAVTGVDPRLAGMSVADSAAELLCAGCCDSAGAAVGPLSDCSPVTCASVDDCYGEGYTCPSGYCACTDSARCPKGAGDAGTGDDANAGEPDGH